MSRYDLPFTGLGRVVEAIVLGALLLGAAPPAPAQDCVPTELSFTFTAEPAQPRVGDPITLTVAIGRTNTAGLPHVSLDGTVPLLGGDLTPDPPVSPSGPVPSSVVYHLVAVEAGEAMLVFHISYEGVTACSDEVGPVFGFLGATSEPFHLLIAPAGEGTVGPPTFTPTPTPTATVFRPTPTDTTTPAGSATATPSPVLGCYLTTLGLSLSAEPANPKVGDEIVLTIVITQTSIAGLPQVSLAGALPLLEGGSRPDPEVSSSGPVPSIVTYRLTAVGAGDAMLTFHISYEGITGCTENGPIYGFRFATSDPPFVLHIAAAEPPTSTPTSTRTSTPTSTVPPTPTSTPTVSPTPTSPPGVALSGGCALADAHGSWGWLVAMAALAALRRGRSTASAPIAATPSSSPRRRRPRSTRRGGSSRA